MICGRHPNITPYNNKSFLACNLWFVADTLTLITPYNNKSFLACNLWQTPYITSYNNKSFLEAWQQLTHSLILRLGERCPWSRFTGSCIRSQRKRFKITLFITTKHNVRMTLQQQLNDEQSLLFQMFQNCTDWSIATINRRSDLLTCALRKAPRVTLFKSEVWQQWLAHKSLVPELWKARYTTSLYKTSRYKTSQVAGR